MQEKFKIIGSYLKNKRKACGLTQADVAKELGYNSPQFISNFERGLCAPSIETYPKLVSLYDLSKNELLKVLLKSEEQHLKKVLAMDSLSPTDRANLV